MWWGRGCGHRRVWGHTGPSRPPSSLGAIFHVVATCCQLHNHRAHPPPTLNDPRRCRKPLSRARWSACTAPPHQSSSAGAATARVRRSGRSQAPRAARLRRVRWRRWRGWDAVRLRAALTPCLRRLRQWRLATLIVSLLGGSCLGSCMGGGGSSLIDRLPSPASHATTPATLSPIPPLTSPIPRTPTTCRQALAAG